MAPSWLRRRSLWDPPTLLDEILLSPLRFLVHHIYLFLLTLRGAPFTPPRNKPRIRIVCISDTHDHILTVPTGDVLIHAGDLTNNGTIKDIQKQIDWLDGLPGFKYKLFIAGNHDSYFDPKSRKEEDKQSGKKLNYLSLKYLQDESIQLKFKGGRTLNVYGAGDIPECGGTSFAFQYPRHLAPWTGRVPINTDVLITHTPPRYHLDLSLGCAMLLQEIWRVKPRLHIVGHVHSGHGRQALFFDSGQAAYERLMSRKQGGILADLIPSQAWIDAIRVLWYGVIGIFWQYLMVGPQGGSGGVLINAALTYRSTSKLGNPVEVVEL